MVHNANTNLLPTRHTKQLTVRNSKWFVLILSHTEKSSHKVVTIFLKTMLSHCSTYIHCDKYVYETVAWLKQPCSKVV